MEVDVNFISKKSVYEAESILSYRITISSATTTNLDILIPQGGDLMSLAIDFSQYSLTDYITAIKVMDSSGTITRHIITKSPVYIPQGQVINLNGENPLFKGCQAGDFIRISYLSLSTISQIIDVYAEIAQPVQTS